MNVISNWYGKTVVVDRVKNLTGVFIVLKKEKKKLKSKKTIFIIILVAIPLIEDIITSICQ